MMRTHQILNYIASMWVVENMNPKRTAMETQRERGRERGEKKKKREKEKKEKKKE